MADPREVADQVRATGEAVALPDEGLAVVPLEEWELLRRLRAMRAVAESGDRLRLNDVDATELIRQERERRSKEQGEGLGLR